MKTKQHILLIILILTWATNFPEVISLSYLKLSGLHQWILLINTTFFIIILLLSYMIVRYDQQELLIKYRDNLKKIILTTLKNKGLKIQQLPEEYYKNFKEKQDVYFIRNKLILIKTIIVNDGKKLIKDM